MSIIHNSKFMIQYMALSFLIFFLVPSHVFAQDISTGLVGHWKFDETSGTTAADSSGSNNTGTLTNGPAWTTGKIGGTVSFDGVDDYINIGNPVSLQLTGSMTISAWINGDIFGTNDIISKKGGSTDRGWEFLVDFSPKKFAIAIADINNIVIDRRSNTTPLAGQWYHVTGVYNAAAQSLDMYVNGALDNGTLTGTVPSSQRNSTRDVTIGRRPGAANRWDGLMDDVRVYNRALTAADIQALYNYTGGPPPAPDTQAPSIPTNLQATVVSSTQINLSWTASTDNVGVTSYRVYRNGTQIASLSTTSYSDTGLSPSTTYSYSVAAVDAAGNVSLQSSSVNGTTQNPPSPDTTPPSTPTNLSATTISSTQINLSWTASTDNVGVTGYRVEHCQGSGCATFAQIAAPTGTSYSDTGLLAGTAYSYRVRAVDAAGNPSGYSSIVSATTQATTVGCTGNTFSFGTFSDT